MIFTKPVCLRTSMLAFALMTGTIAQAADSEWLTGTQLRAHISQLQRTQQLPTGIDCENGPGAEPMEGAVLIRVSSVPNPQKLRWHIIWGESGYFKRGSAKFAQQGFRRVDQGSFTRPKSGLNIICAVFQK